MCSEDRQDIEALENKLHRAGIQSEVRSNALTAALGITRLEVFVDEDDLRVASQVCQDLAVPDGQVHLPGDFRAVRRINGHTKHPPREVDIEAKVISPPETEVLEDDAAARPAEVSQAETEGDLTEATTLLEKEVEALLGREAKLVGRCASLEEKLDGLELRLKESEQALKEARSQVDSQARQLSQRQARITDFEKEVASHQASVKKLDQSLAQSRAGLAQEEKLRVGAEQKCGKLETALRALEGQVKHLTEQREQLIKERRVECRQMQSSVSTVNDLRSRVRARLAAKEKQGLPTSK